MSNGIRRKEICGVVHWSARGNNSPKEKWPICGGGKKKESGEEGDDKPQEDLSAKNNSKCVDRMGGVKCNAERWGWQIFALPCESRKEKGRGERQ